jgi:hypothetical protein
MAVYLLMSSTFAHRKSFDLNFLPFHSSYCPSTLDAIQFRTETTLSDSKTIACDPVRNSVLRFLYIEYWNSSLGKTERCFHKHRRARNYLD